MLRQYEEDTGAIVSDFDAIDARDVVIHLPAFKQSENLYDE